MEKSNNPFRTAGMALLIVGIIDIGIMIYCIANEIHYSSSFNIFAVIAGILLIRGGVKSARIIRWLSIFFAIAALGWFLITPIFTPFDLLLLKFKIHPQASMLSFLFSLLTIWFLYWVFQQLSTDNSKTLFEAASYKIGFPKYAVIISLLLLTTSVVFLGNLFSSEAADKAKSLAMEKYGPEYKYNISELGVTTRGSASSHFAVMTAYTKNEYTVFTLHW